MSKYEELMSELPRIKEMVESFPEGLQDKVFDVIISSYQGVDIIRTEVGKGVDESKGGQKEDKSDVENLQGVAVYKNGNFHYTVRDLKGNSKKEKLKKLVYSLLYSYKKLTGEDGVSRKEIINDVLKKYRLYDGNARAFLTSDKGLIVDGDIYSLDFPAEAEAEEIIRELQGSSNNS